MEGVIDAPMRELLTRVLPIDFVVTEFFRISSNVPPRRSYYDLCPELKTGGRTANGTPVLFQLLGGDAQLMAQAAERAVELGALGVDINFGCPAPTVNRHDGGASLLRDSRRIELIVSAVRKALPTAIPVSAKLRLGWASTEDIDENARAALNGGASWITIHARTRMQAYAPPVFWDRIGRVTSQTSAPVVANGDIWNIDDVEKCVKMSGTRLLMLGRGLLADPALAWRAASWLGTPGYKGTQASFPSGSEGDVWSSLLKALLDLRERYGRPSQGSVRVLKQWMAYRQKRNPFSGFDRLKLCESSDDFLRILEEENCFSSNQQSDRINPEAKNRGQSSPWRWELGFGNTNPK